MVHGSSSSTNKIIFRDSKKFSHRISIIQIFGTPYRYNLCYYLTVFFHHKPARKWMCTVEKPFYVNEAQYYKPLIPITEEVKQEDALSSQGLDQYIITEQDKRQAGRKDRRKGRGREAESFL